MYFFVKDHLLIGYECHGCKRDGVQCLIGGNNGKYVLYWSSSENSKIPGRFNFAWFQFFNDGSQSQYDKIDGCFGVRAIRAFDDNNLEIQQTEDGIPWSKEYSEKHSVLNLKTLIHQY